MINSFSCIVSLFMILAFIYWHNQFNFSISSQKFFLWERLLISNSITLFWIVKFILCSKISFNINMFLEKVTESICFSLWLLISPSFFVFWVFFVTMNLLNVTIFAFIGIMLFFLAFALWTHLLVYLNILLNVAFQLQVDGAWRVLQSLLRMFQCSYLHQ